MEPRPVRYASSIPLRPTIKPLVGKSGPFTIPSIVVKESSGDASGLSKAHCTALHISRRLCGGMLVAIPTAIPAEPLTNKFGKRLGSTTGSWDLPS
ncbi:unannotated protein [freshwater metagenome]|uniref:Unannotated protein n=1 Tax=freshwater metagenome TaxID=449393 RepID=A0A6J7JEY9_9ZZZZ